MNIMYLVEFDIYSIKLFNIYLTYNCIMDLAYEKM